MRRYEKVRLWKTWFNCKYFAGKYHCIYNYATICDVFWILVFKGEVKINENHICKETDFIIFDNIDGDISVQSVTEESLFVVLSGEPIDEPIVSHGPFVMNTVDEIYQAYEDFRNNKFGVENF